MSCEQPCGLQLKSISGSIFIVKLVEDDFETTTVEFTEIIKNFTTGNVILSSYKAIREMANFTMEQEFNFYHQFSATHFHFETVEFLQRKIKTATFWS